MDHSTTKILEIYVHLFNREQTEDEFRQTWPADHNRPRRLRSAARAAFLVGLIASELTLNRLLRKSEPRLRQGVTTAGKH
jgi:hypothetical protein